MPRLCAHRSARQITIAIVLCSAQPALAHSIRQRVGAYNDNQGLVRRRLTYDMDVDGPRGHATMSSSSFNVLVRRETLMRQGMANQQRDQKIYGSGYHVNDSASLGATQTWNRITETRVLAAYSTDRQVSSRTWSAGASQWLAHETLRLSGDLSRTQVQQPLFEILDYDSRSIAEPTAVSSTGISVGARHLARPTTVVDYSASHIVNDNRPSTRSGGIAVRQFIPPLDGAVHAAGTRVYNRGYISTDTTYGQVDAWIAESAYLQNLWTGAVGRLGYRYYKEDETTRAYEDLKVFGSDTISIGLTQDLPKKAIDGLATPLTLEAVAARYLTNTHVAATSFEVGVAAKL